MSDDKHTNSVHKESIPVYGASPEWSAFLAPREKCWDVILQEVGKNLRKRNFGVSVAATLQDAAALVMTRLLPESGARTVAFGGSMTVREAGLLEALQAHPDVEIINTLDAGIGPEALIEVRRQALLCDLFLCSANAITRDGVIMLLDGYGNRTAAVQFGPRKVILLIGRNKICSTKEAALSHVKDIAAPANCIRLNKKTPCSKVGRCMDCNSPDRICSVWTILERNAFKDRIHVVLINEDAGY